MHKNNRIIPVKGDFSGTKTINTIASFISERNNVLSMFYFSNVEYFLFRDNLIDKFVTNIKKLPFNEKSLLVRAFLNTPSQIHPEGQDRQFFVSIAQSVNSYIKHYDQGRYKTYWDIGTRDYI